MNAVERLMANRAPTCGASLYPYDQPPTMRRCMLPPEHEGDHGPRDLERDREQTRRGQAFLQRLVQR